MAQTRQNMGSGNVKKLLLQLMIPAVVAQVVNLLYNIVDRIYIGHISGIGAAALTGVGLFTPILMLLNAFAMLIGSGGAPRTAIAMGQGDKKQAEKIVSNSFTMLLLFSVVLTIVFYAAAPTLLRLFGASEATLPYALAYSRIYILGSVCVLLVMGMNPFITTQGFAKISMLTTVIGAVINIILDPIMIFGLLGCPAMGIAGAAIATVIGQIGGMTLGLVLNQAKNVELRLHLKGFRPNKTILKGILDVGFPSIIMQSISSVMNVLMNMILLGFGATAVNVLGVYFKLQSFVFMPVFGLSNGLVAILGYNYGARMRARVYDALKVALIWACVIMLLGTIAFLLIPETLLSLFEAGNARDLTDMGVVALRVISLSFLLAAVGITISTLFQAVGKGMYSLWMSLCRQIIVLLPVAWLLSKTGNVDAVWWSFPIAELFSVALCLLLYRRVDRNMLQKL